VLGGLSDDDHTQYLLLTAGRGGQTIDDAVVITGNLTVQGTTTTLDTATLTVQDKNIEIGYIDGVSETDITIDGGGLTFLGSTNKTITWDNANDNFSSSEHINIAAGKQFKINNINLLDNTTTLGVSTTTAPTQNAAKIYTDDTAIAMAIALG